MFQAEPENGLWKEGGLEGNSQPVPERQKNKIVEAKDENHVMTKESNIVSETSPGRK